MWFSQSFRRAGQFKFLLLQIFVTSTYDYLPNCCHTLGVMSNYYKEEFCPGPGGSHL
jgi:hypothetical protein